MSPKTATALVIYRGRKRKKIHSAKLQRAPSENHPSKSYAYEAGKVRQ